MYVCNMYRLLILFFPGLLAAQSYTQLLEQAERAVLEGDFATAMTRYAAAAESKQQDAASYLLAADAALRVRDYDAAVQYFELGKSKFDYKSPVVFLYARALKQQGRCEQALPVWDQFLKQYRGDNPEFWRAETEKEMAGCRETPMIRPDWQLLYSDSLNTFPNAAAPQPFGADLLYFSLPGKGRARLMRARGRDADWSAPAPALGLPPEAAARFGGGAFSADGSRFYCTQCEANDAGARNGFSFSAQCALYVLRLGDRGWGAPERLPEYINMPGSVSTHPFVLQQGNEERLFFASDRPGGLGGFDLYTCVRPVDADALDFSFPQNLGKGVNSAGDEITPCYDAKTGILWYAGNGFPGLGGFDIYAVTRDAAGWGSRQHAGAPLNSTADDYFPALRPLGKGLFLVSNRIHLPFKTNTRTQGIFEFGDP